jgi:Bacterial Ig-like domain (group 3)
LAAPVIKRSPLVYGLLSVALMWSGVSAGVLTGSGSAAASTVSGVWQSPQVVPGLAGLSVGGQAAVSVVSCSAMGECSGAGFYKDAAGHYQTFVTDERRGVWGPAQELPGSAALNVGGNLVPNAISCASPGNCAVGGNYTDGSGNIQAWVADEANGVWQDAEELPGTKALNTGGNAMVNSISCAAPGYCAAGGTYTVTGTNPPAAAPFVASETKGTWSAAVEVPGTGDYSTLNSVSCGSPGDCVAGGSASVGAYLATETSGAWGSAQPVAGTAALPGDQPEVTAVSCESSGCDAVGKTGDFDGEGFGVTETGDAWGSTWRNAAALPLPVSIPSGDYGTLQPQSLSCTSPGDCTAVGFYATFTSDFAGVDQEGVTVGETGGTWGTPRTVPSLVALDSAGSGSIPSVSCPAPGDCAAVGVYGDDTGSHSALMSEINNAWGTAQPLWSAPGEAVSQSISCGAVAYCSVGGSYEPLDNQFTDAIVADETPILPTTTTESLSASRVTYGHEQAEVFSVTVSAALGIADGKVIVTSAGKAACTIRLVGGIGACTIPEAKFNAGPHALTARYGGALGFDASSSAVRRFTVGKATSKTSLTLSKDKVRYGHERAEKLTVKVLPQYSGRPGGKVIITAGRVRVCVITLKHTTGSCRLGARTLRAGRYEVLAAYRGNPDFNASTSPKKRIIVTH